MNRPRDRKTAAGLLPRMEARPRKDGLVTYRYHPVGGKPMNLGTDRAEALRKVLELNGQLDASGTIGRLWELFQASPAWHDLRPRTQADYEAYSVPLLAWCSDARAADITAPDVSRYLRVERATAPVRGNREVALLGVLMALAIERGEALVNPCRGGQVKRNKERPRETLPAAADIAALVEFARARDAAVKSKVGRATVVVLAAEFAALTGARQAEFLPLHWPAFDEAEVRLERSKQRLGVKKVDRISVSPALAALRGRLLAFQHSAMGPVFPTRRGNVYTASGFAGMWQKLMVDAVEAGAVKNRFNFHALRAFYATEHKGQHGALPELHQSEATTARVYERSKVSRRKSL